MTPKISVILPVYNGQKYLFDCINSVMMQIFGEFELLIGDDCSTAETKAIIESFDDRRIRRFYRENNQGLFRNLNLLIAEAKAPLLHFLCQDDLLEPQCLQQTVEFFERHSEISMSFCKCLIIDEHSREVEKGAIGDLPETVSPSFSMQLFFYYGCIPGNLSSVCLRQSIVEIVGFFDGSLNVSGDYEMWVRVCQQADLGVIHQHLIRLRRHRLQLSRADNSGLYFISENRRIRSIILSLLPQAIRIDAMKYSRWRQNVFDSHYIVKCLISGRLNDFIAGSRILGVKDFIVGLLYWVITLNNHLYRPKPVFSVDKRDSLNEQTNDWLNHSDNQCSS